MTASDVTYETRIAVFVVDKNRVLLLKHRTHGMWLPTDCPDAAMIHDAVHHALRQVGLKSSRVRFVQPREGLGLKGNKAIPDRERLRIEPLLVNQLCTAPASGPVPLNLVFIAEVIRKNPRRRPVVRLANHAHVEYAWFNRASIKALNPTSTYRNVRFYALQAIRLVAGIRNAMGNGENELNYTLVQEQDLDS